MEGAAIAQAAYLNNVPFLVIRAISDKADGSAEMDYPTFEAMAAEHSFKLTLRILKDIRGTFRIVLHKMIGTMVKQEPVHVLRQVFTILSDLCQSGAL